jgi:hypothetical protein
MSANPSNIPCLTLAPNNWVQVSRQEWDELQAELHHLRSLVGGSGHMGEVIRAAARVSDVRVEDILGRCRPVNLTRIRLAIFVVARGMEIDPQSILVAMRRNRTLHLHYARSAERYLATDPKLRDLIKRLEEACC